MDKVVHFILCILVLSLASCGKEADFEKHYTESGHDRENFEYSAPPGSILEFPDGEPFYYLTTNDISVPVHERVRVNVGDPNQSHELYLTGAGVRVKKVFIFSVNVYVLASYVYDLSAISQSNPKGDIQTSQVKALHMTAVRDIGADDIRSSFEQSLMANSIDINRPAVKDLMGKITFDVLSEDEITFIGYEDGSQQTVHILTGDQTFTGTDDTLADDFWKMWFGIPIDDEVYDLQDQLLGDLVF